MTSNANEYKQKQRTKIKKLPLVSLASGLFPTLLFLMSDNEFFTRMMMDYAFFDLICGWSFFILPVIGFICGLYYLIRVKIGSLLERICAILGTSLSGLWLCILFIKN